MEKQVEKIFLNTIDEKRKGDPFIGAKIGADYVLNTLIEILKDENGVHAETMLCVLGSLAGYSCQICVREYNILNGLNEFENFHIAYCKNGEKYFYGDILNKYVAEGENSVWKLITIAVSDLNKSCPDIIEIFEYVTKVIGTDKFGIIRFPNGQYVDYKLKIVLVKLWPKIFLNIKKYCKSPEEYPVLFGLALQKVIVLTKDVISADIAAKIAMECVISMSKFDMKENSL